MGSASSVSKKCLSTTQVTSLNTSPKEQITTTREDYYSPKLTNSSISDKELLKQCENELLRQCEQLRSSRLSDDQVKELLTMVIGFLNNNKRNQSALCNECIRDIMTIVKSCSAVTEALQIIIYLCRCDGTRRNNPDIKALSHDNYSIKNIEELGACGACEVVVEFLKSFGESDVNITELGFWAIYCLAFSSSNREKLGLCGACKVVTDLLNIHYTSANVTETGCWAIYSLSFNNSLNKASLGTDIGCEVVVEALKIHGKSSSSVAEAGCYAISNLAANDDINNAKLGDCGACEIVIEVLKVHGKTNIDIAEAGCLAICNLAFIESNRDKLGICNILMELRQMYKERNMIIASCEDIILLLQ